jgi:ankyrin repeat protein
MIASAKGHVRCVKYLLAHKAGLDYQNIWGRTAVMEGIYSGHLDIISLLVQSGADTTLKDKDGKTIKDYTRQYRLEERLGEVCHCSYCEDLEKGRKIQQKIDEEKEKEKKKLISDLIYERKTKLISELTCDEILIWLENIKMPAMFIAIFKNNNISGVDLERCDSESYLSDTYNVISLHQSKTFFKSIETLRETSIRSASRIPLKLIQHT